MTLFDFALSRSQPIYFWHSSDSIDTWLADSLLARARAISVQMQKQGATVGDCIALMLPSGVDLITGILAAWGCRATICIVPHSLGESSGKLDSLKMSHIFELIKPKLIIHDFEQQGLFSETQAQKICWADWQNLPIASDFPAKPQLDDIAIIQLTSGSTAYPKGVILQHAQVVANMQAIVKRLATTQNDHTVSWLPFYHDMGLSSLLISLMGDFPLTLIQTAYFMRNASVWLTAITQQCATLTHAPAFAYALLNRQKTVLKKYPIDLSSLRYASVGAEPLHAKHLDTFKEIMRNFGLKDNVLQPAYGLAESVVAVSFNSGEKPYHCLSIDGDELHTTGYVKAVDTNQTKAITLVSNGSPLDDISIKICLENGELAQKNQQGHIWISGDSVTKSYINNVDSELFQNGWFNTGDLGFLNDGEIYISGRANDTIIRGGATISPAYIEYTIENYLNLKTGRVVVFSVQDFEKSIEKVVAIIGLQIAKENQPKLTREIATYVSSVTHLQIDKIFFTAPSNIPKTTSGKVQRSTIKQLFLDGIFEGYFNGNSRALRHICLHI